MIDHLLVKYIYGYNLFFYSSNLIHMCAFFKLFTIVYEKRQDNTIFMQVKIW